MDRNYLVKVSYQVLCSKIAISTNLWFSKLCIISLSNQRTLLQKRYSSHVMKSSWKHLLIYLMKQMKASPQKMKSHGLKYIHSSNLNNNLKQPSLTENKQSMKMGCLSLKVIQWSTSKYAIPLLRVAEKCSHLLIQLVLIQTLRLKSWKEVHSMSMKYPTSKQEKITSLIFNFRKS